MDDDTACPEIRFPNHPKGFGGPAKSISGSTNVSGPKDLHHSDLAGLAKNYLVGKYSIQNVICLHNDILRSEFPLIPVHVKINSDSQKVVLIQIVFRVQRGSIQIQPDSQKYSN